MNKMYEFVAPTILERQNDPYGCDLLCYASSGDTHKELLRISKPNPPQSNPKRTTGCSTSRRAVVGTIRLHRISVYGWFNYEDMDYRFRIVGDTCRKDVPRIHKLIKYMLAEQNTKLYRGLWTFCKTLPQDSKEREMLMVLIQKLCVEDYKNVCV